ncbi:MAG TPA: hypothetical protein EYP85_07200 [Armatimonadetes bacterium]|nr:hypothetical protein [Armatimonadota bacterium]
MRRRPGEGAPEARVKRRVRARLQELGFAEEDWEEEARVVFYPGRVGNADFLVRLEGAPAIVVEAEGRAEQFERGFLQARAYGVMLDPERPVPYLMVVAGRKEGLFHAEVPPAGGPGVRYVPVERLLTKEELLDAVEAPAETFARDVAVLDRFVTLFEQMLREIQSGRGLRGEQGLLTLADLLSAEVSGDGQGMAKVYADYRVAKRIQRALARLLEPHGDLSRYQGWALGYAFRQVVRPFFRGGEYGRYFTPPEVIRFMVDVAAPKPEELVLDPVCGSGGFLGRIAWDWLRQGLPPEDVAALLIGCDQDELCVKVATAFLTLLLSGW